LIPVFQLIGAALATSISVFFGVLIAGLYVYAKFKTFLNFSSILKILLASTVISVISLVYQVSGLILLIQYLILFAIYLILLYFLKGVKQEDIEKGKVLLRIFRHTNAKVKV
jgi:O-antigen/teichoic acid export membrane protein